MNSKDTGQSAVHIAAVLQALLSYIARSPPVENLGKLRLAFIVLFGYIEDDEVHPLFSKIVKRCRQDNYKQWSGGRQIRGGALETCVTRSSSVRPGVMSSPAAIRL
jgi:hypothetical protein